VQHPLGLRGCPCFSGVAGEPLSNQSEKAFDVRQLPASLPNLLVGWVLLKNRLKLSLVGLPEVTEALFFAILRWNLCPQPSASLRRSVSDPRWRRSAGSVGRAQPRASVCSTAGARRSSTRQVRGHRLLRAAGPDWLAGGLRVPFFEPPGESISAYSENTADRAFGPALSVGLKNALFFFLRICVRVRIKHQISSAVLAVVLLRPAGTVAVFDDVGASTFAAGVGRLNHGLI